MNKLNRQRFLLSMLSGIIALWTIFTGCVSGGTPAPADSSVSSPEESEPMPDLESESTLSVELDPQYEEAEKRPPEIDYIQQTVDETIKKLVEPGMTEYEMAKAAFDYLIETSYYEEPIGQDLWRIRGGGDLPSYEENRALSILLFGIGYCEDYASALVLLLEGMGMEARYVAGVTYSRYGYLVNHAWTVAKIDGVWYHLDAQLEDRVTQNDWVTYRFFMKSDGSMRKSHLWGQNLIDSGWLSAEQNEEIAQYYLYESCPEDYPTPESQTIVPTPFPDIAAILAEIEEERRAYELLYGKLEEIDLNVIPPVFGEEDWQSN